MAKCYFHGLNWVNNKFVSYNYFCLKRLLKYSHLSSLQVILRGNTELSAGSEHFLYYAIMGNKLYNSKLAPYHGEIVSIGTLITLWCYKYMNNQSDWFDKLKKAYIKLGLPVNFVDLEKIGITLDSLIESYSHFTNKSYLVCELVSKIGIKEILMEVFGEKRS